MEKELTKADWLRAARLALLRGGPEAVRVERLARTLRVTKGSFYWHFSTRGQLLEFLLQEWEQELPELLVRMKGRSRSEALHFLVSYMVKATELSERGEAPSDAAVFAWASVSPAVAARVNAIEKKRLAALNRITGRRDRVEPVYLMWLGFVARGQRLPGSRKRFPQIARMMLNFLTFPVPPRSAQGKTGATLRPPSRNLRRTR
jgi:AcrR family transcriptional regulator